MIKLGLWGIKVSSGQKTWAAMCDERSKPKQSGVHSCKVEMTVELMSLPYVYSTEAITSLRSQNVLSGQAVPECELDSGYKAI